MSAYGDLGTSMLPDETNSLKSQIYDESTGETWADFFQTMALEQMKADNKIYLAALENKYQLPDEEKEKMNAEIENFKSVVYTNTNMNFSDYLQRVYGNSMTEAAYKKNVERTYLVNTYVDYVKDSYSYTPEVIEEYYNENKDTFDTFTFRYFLVNSAEVNKSDYPDDASYEAADAAAIEAAGVKASEYAAKITDEQSFIDVAREYDPEEYKEDDSTQRIYKGELTGSTYGKWLQEEGRQNGDVSTFKTSTGYYVVMYEARDNNHYPTVNIQQIFVKQEAVDETQFVDDQSAYDLAVSTAKKTAEDTANSIYQEWLDGGATQDKLAELITSHSTEISTDSSKLNENVERNSQKFPAEVNSWIYDSARKPGDHTILYADPTGYYIVHFIGAGKQYSDVLSDTQKRENDLQAWKDNLTGSEPKMTWLMALTK
jgi:hypothetical protein